MRIFEHRALEPSDASSPLDLAIGDRLDPVSRQFEHVLSRRLVCACGALDGELEHRLEQQALVELDDGCRSGDSSGKRVR